LEIIPGTNKQQITSGPATSKSLPQLRVSHWLDMHILTPLYIALRGRDFFPK
jgi:hypothetical protein